MGKFSIGYCNEPENFEPPEPRFVLQNRTSNLPNHPKKTELRTRFVPSLESAINYFGAVSKLAACLY